MSDSKDTPKVIVTPPPRDQRGPLCHFTLLEDGTVLDHRPYMKPRIPNNQSPGLTPWDVVERHVTTKEHR